MAFAGCTLDVNSFNAEGMWVAQRLAFQLIAGCGDQCRQDSADSSCFFK